MVAALALLIIVPATATPGRVTFEDVNEATTAIVVSPDPALVGNEFTVVPGTGLYESVSMTGAMVQETRVGEGKTYVSNDLSAYNMVIFEVKPVPALSDADDPNLRRVSVKPSRGIGKNIVVDVAGVGYFHVVAQRTSLSNVEERYQGVHNAAVVIAAVKDQEVIAAADPNIKIEIPTREGQAVYEAVLEGGTVTVNDIVTTYGTRLADADAGRDVADTVPLLVPINAREIEAVNNVSITIDGDVTIYVDGVAPDISDVSPGSGALQDSDRVDFSFTVKDGGSGARDNGSGLRSDRERPIGDTDTDRDADGISTEPLAGAFGYGKDIGVFLSLEYPAETRTDLDTAIEDPVAGINLPGVTDPIAANLRVDNRGDDDWNEVDRDYEYSIDFRTSTLALPLIPGTDDEVGTATFKWYILARDRAGNVARYPSDETKDAEITIDREGPEAGAGDFFAGIGYDDGEEVRDASSIAVVFPDEGAHGLNEDSIDAGAFSVAGNTVVDVIYPGNERTTNDEGKCTSDTGLVALSVKEPKDCINTLNRVYLTLATPLESDATPEVQISSSKFTDLAGNGNRGAEEEASDWIVPDIDITVTGDVSTDGRPLAQEDITVRVESGEILAGRPEVWLVTVDAEGKIAVAGNSRLIGTITGEDRIWESEYDADKFRLDDEGGFGAIIIIGADSSENQNQAVTPGWKGKGEEPEDGDELDLAKLDAAGLLVEFDAAIPDVDVEVTPNRGDDRQTESANPFVKLTFEEGNEYTTVTIPEVAAVVDDNATAVDETKAAIPATPGGNSVEQGDDKTDVDSYGTVTITAITLDGEDASAGLARIDKSEFNLSLRSLAVGEYTLEITASDTAGNEETWEEDFEVLKRSAYEIELRPGWNLISVPADPTDPAIGSVLPDDHSASQVLSYQNSEWVTAIREPETGVWSGTLTEIEAGYGYFVQTNSFDPLETLIPEADPTSRLPVVAVVSGWNMLGVVDVGQSDAGEPIDADLYLASIEWSVAYGFDTTTNRWQKITTDEDPCGSEEGEKPCLENGSGYWVWATEQGTLVP